MCEILNIEKITALVIKNTPLDTQYEIRPSLSTNSFYITFTYGEQSATLRLSDHFQKEKGVKTLVVKPRTKSSLVERTITNTIIGLKQLSLDIKLGITQNKKT